MMLSEMLATFLAAAHAAGIPLVERADAPSTWPQRITSPAGLPAIHAFGHLAVASPHDPLSFVPTIPLRARQLLAMLLVAHPEAVPAETLMERLFPDSEPKKAANGLYVAVHALRRTLQPSLTSGSPARFLIHESDAYRLHLDAGIWVDTREFEAAYQRGRRLVRSDRAEAGVLEFRRALALYRGPFLAEGSLDLSPETEAVRQRFRNECAEMARFVVRHLGESGRWSEASDVVNELRRADPWDQVFLDLVNRIMRRSLPPAE
jgi:DNA-binding SARP family transcriptional activator